MMLTIVFQHYPLFDSTVGSRPPFGAVSVFWRRRQLITNSVAAMRFVRDGLSMRVVVVNPDPRIRSTRNLADSATYVKRLWKSHLKRSQFPDTLTDEIGTITKSPDW